MKPITAPAHEAMESPSMERKEHKTGKEMMNIRKGRKFTKAARPMPKRNRR